MLKDNKDEAFDPAADGADLAAFDSTDVERFAPRYCSACAATPPIRPALASPEILEVAFGDHPYGRTHWTLESVPKIRNPD